MEVLNKKISKISSQQSGPFSTGSGVGNNRHVDVVINQSYGVISLKDTFLQLRMTILPDDTSETLVIPYNLANTSTVTAPVRNLDLIRNCYMQCSNYGMLENIRRQNVLHKNLKEFEDGISSKLSQGQSLYNVYDPSTALALSPFIEVHKDDGFQSRLTDAHLKVKISDLFELGSVDMLDLSKLGDLNIHIEIEDKNYFTVTTDVYSNMLPNPIQQQMQDISGVSEPTVLVAQYQYQSKPQVPFYQGMPLAVDYNYDVSGTDTSGTLTTSISSLSIVQATASGVVSDYVVTITIEDPLSPSTNNQYTNIVVTPLQNIPLADYNIVTVDLAVSHYLNATQNMNVLQWTTYTTEEFTNGNTNLSKIFELEPECTAVVVAFANSNALLSNYTDTFTFRMRVDNADQYEYDVECNRNPNQGGQLVDLHDALYYDGLSKLFTQIGRKLNCIVPALNTNSIVTPTNGYTNQSLNKVILLGTPTQLTPLTKLFQLTIQNKNPEPDQDSVINEIVLFKQVQKTLNL
jgi:hypothetical protein